MAENKVLIEMGIRAKAASRKLAAASSAEKDKALDAMAATLLENQDKILAANQTDLEAAQANGMSRAMLDRLALNPQRIASMAQGIRQVASLTDPVGEIVEGIVRPNGLRIQKTRVPLGVVGIIYEARPNVTSDAAALCIKSGNACILRGGKEAINSNIAVANALRQGLARFGFEECVQLLEDTSRETAAQMMRLREYIDVLIPRGGAGLIKSVVENSTIPVIETGVGNCHVYIDEFASRDMAVSITVNAKTSRPSVCNAAETLLVHKFAAPGILPDLARELKNAGVQLRGCEETRKLLSDPDIVPATEEDWATEYLDYIMAVKIVSSIDEAIEHITRYGSGHSECIVTDSYASAEKFTSQVDAAAVYVNASTRFTDGGEFGMGAEIGISTQKLHARGPMGLQELTTTKFIVYGNGQIR
ncbi:MAG TPA: glutamate-5-semialdehyde dehydrogenase [Candidatus Avimonas sp.]|nr:glutamate-5-semialdehyde dehydrogenase [Candidatus Avimonas sp.]